MNAGSTDFLSLLFQGLFDLLAMLTGFVGDFFRQILTAFLL